MHRGDVWFIPVPCSVPSKQGSEYVSSHLLLAPLFSLWEMGSLKPTLGVDTSVSRHRGDWDRHRILESLGRPKE